MSAVAITLLSCNNNNSKDNIDVDFESHKNAIQAEKQRQSPLAPIISRANEIKFIRKFQRIPMDMPQLNADFLAWKKGYWREKIQSGNITNVVAPMVDQSELAFRMLCRKYSAHLCYTPMIHAQLFVTDPTYRRTSFSTVEMDRPLIVQFCANDPQMLLNACLIVDGYCDGVDLNLGCPQVIAKKGRYGAFLQEDPELIEQMVSTVHKHCRLPLSVKIRALQDVASTIAYAKRLEQAGASMLTIHGRTREQKGVNTGLADWNYIRAVKQALSIPVLANGNIQMPGDIERCMAETGADGVMSAEGVLSNPLLLHGQNRFSFDVALEYLDFAERYDAPFSAVRAHIFRICHYSFLKYADLRDRNALCCTLQEFRKNINDLRERCIEEMRVCGHEPEAKDNNNAWTNAMERCFSGLAINGNATTTKTSETTLNELVQRMPHYFCKPYIRPEPQTNGTTSSMAAATQNSNSNGNHVANNITNGDIVVVSSFRQQKQAELERLAAEAGVSKRQIRKRQKRRFNRQKQMHRRQTYPHCERCQQPAGVNCANQMCRRCCKFVCLQSIADGITAQQEPIELECQAHNFDHDTLKEMRARKQKHQQINKAAQAINNEKCDDCNAIGKL